MTYLRKCATAAVVAAFSFATFLCAPMAARAQEGPVATQTLVGIDSKSGTMPQQQEITLKVANRNVPLTAWKPVTGPNSAGVEVALLIDDGLRESVGRQIDDIRNFIKKMPDGMVMLVGYMQNGRVNIAQDFTRDHAAAAAAVRLPLGARGASASPYYCLEDFIHHWPISQHARFVFMITDGVDPANGRDTVMNQDSPNVKNAAEAAERAGVVVYSIYYTDAGFTGPLQSFSGQNYLAQVAGATGGIAYLEGDHNPVAMAPYLDRFLKAISETYVATFTAVSGSGSRSTVPIHITTSDKGTKLRYPEIVSPGNPEAPAAQ